MSYDFYIRDIWIESKITSDNTELWEDDEPEVMKEYVISGGSNYKHPDHIRKDGSKIIFGWEMYSPFKSNFELQSTFIEMVLYFQVCGLILENTYKIISIFYENRMSEFEYISALYMQSSGNIPKANMYTYDGHHITMEVNGEELEFVARPKSGEVYDYENMLKRFYRELPKNTEQYKNFLAYAIKHYEDILERVKDSKNPELNKFYVGKRDYFLEVYKGL